MWDTILYQPLFNLLIVFYNFLGHNMGLAIIALTILVRLILMPMTKKSLVVQKKMKELQPHLEKIKKDHGHDRQKMTKATFELYQQHGFNPLTASCLPLLIQLPIFFALYRVFWQFNQFSQMNMLYPFVQKPEAINSHFLWLDLAGRDALYILPILAGLTVFWQSKMMMPKQNQQPSVSSQQSTEQKMEEFQRMFSRQMIYLFPAMTFFISLKLPAALSLYWVVTTLFGIIQQYWVMKGDKRAGGAKGTIINIRKRE